MSNIKYLKRNDENYKVIMDAFKKAFSAPRVTCIRYYSDNDTYKATCHTGWKYYNYKYQDDRTLNASDIFPHNFEQVSSGIKKNV